ncbi:hypothetical protein PSTG_19920, partial [Puccinia striiformis f. sp. tritici PST-78]
MFDQTSEHAKEKEHASNNNNVNPKKQTNAPKPPPIYVQKVEVISKLHQALNTLKCKYELKILRENEVKIQAGDS